MENSPLASDWVDWPPGCNSIRAPCSTPWLGSETLPVMLPAPCCADKPLTSNRVTSSHTPAETKTSSRERMEEPLSWKVADHPKTSVLKKCQSTVNFSSDSDRTRTCYGQ